MKTIDQGALCNISVEKLNFHGVDIIVLHQNTGRTNINKQGAKQLIEVLKEWVGSE